MSPYESTPPPSPGPSLPKSSSNVPSTALDSEDLAPAAPEMTSKAEADGGTTPLASSTASAPLVPSPFAYAGADSDASSELASDSDDDLPELQPHTISTLSGQVRPSITRRDPPAIDDPLSAAPPPPAVRVQDFALHGSAPTGNADQIPASPVSIDLPVHGDRPHREVRLQRPNRPDTFRPGTEDSDAARRISDDDEDGVFAFQRPPTAPKNGVSSGSLQNSSSMSPSLTANMMEPAPLDGFVSGWDSDRHYDPSHPPPYSGRENLNNSVFAFGHTHRRHYSSHRTPVLESYKLQPPNTGTTASTELTSDGDDSNRPINRPTSTGFGGRFRRISRPNTGRLTTGRPSTMGSSSFDSQSEWTEGSEFHYRPQTGITEMTGDATVPDGATTWGDGVGGELKDADPSKVDWLDEDSPYAEVRASVSNLDDAEMPALTLRAWCLGMFLCMVTAGANVFFSFRNPSPLLPLIVVQVIAYPLGRFLAWALPMRTWTLPKWLGGFSFSLNPCPFNVKEHTVIAMMANVSTPPAFLYVLASQMIGLAMAGIARRFVVWPASMIWPGVLVQTTNLNTLHAESNSGTGSMSRIRFFCISAAAAFAYYFLPGYLFSALSYFSWVCWIAPKSNVVNQLFGVTTGLGMGILTFDWAQIAWIGTPLANPWWAQVNVGIGFILFYWIIVPIMYYTNTWYTSHLPVSSIHTADRFGNIYNVTRLLSDDYTLNTTAYAEYSPVYLTASFTMTYMLAYALTTSLVVYTALVHGKRIVRTVRSVTVEPEDIHMKLMKVYPEVPDWWYIVVLVGFIIMGLVTVEVFSTGLPVWGYLIALSMSFIYIIPAAIMYALSNLQPAVNLIAELIPGYVFQGSPLAGMVFKTFAVQTLNLSMAFVKDMKAGHYMKVPPRSMFIAQMSSCAICTIVQVAVKEWLFRTIPDICAYHQKDQLLCSNQRTAFSASIIWGLVGPARLFNKGGIYNPQLWMLLVGALLPFPFWLYCRRYPKSNMRNINVAVIFCVCMFIPPATGFNVASFLLVGFVFQFWIRRYRFAWWSKYNYVLSAALDVGTLLSVVFIFLTLRLPNARISWWGNNVYMNTKDWYGSAVTPTPPGGFGPDKWKV